MIRVNLTAPMSTRIRVQRLVMASVLFAFLLCVGLVDPGAAPLPTCVFHRMTGCSCPTCGMTRSLHSMSRLQLGESFRFHAMGPAVFFGLFLLVLKFSFETAVGKRIEIAMKPLSRKTFIAGFFGIWMCFWVIRIIGEFL